MLQGTEKVWDSREAAPLIDAAQESPVKAPSPCLQSPEDGLEENLWMMWLAVFLRCLLMCDDVLRLL